MNSYQKCVRNIKTVAYNLTPTVYMTDISEFMGKTFQAAQLTHERFLTIDHSCKISGPESLSKIYMNQ